MSSSVDLHLSALGHIRSLNALRLPTLLLVAVCAGSCTRLARCEMDKVRADVLDYEVQTRPLAAEERRLRGRVAEFEGKVFTNQKAGVDLLRALLARATDDFARKLARVKVRSRLLRPHHRAKVAAYRELARAYRQLMDAYPRADFDAIRQGHRLRERAMRHLEAANLKLSRLIRKYRLRQR